MTHKKAQVTLGLSLTTYLWKQLDLFVHLLLYCFVAAHISHSRSCACTFVFFVTTFPDTSGGGSALFFIGAEV